MRPDPFCDPGDDGQEPDGCLPPAGQDAEPAQEGLFLACPPGPWTPTGLPSPARPRICRRTRCWP